MADNLQANMAAFSFPPTSVPSSSPPPLAAPGHGGNNGSGSSTGFSLQTPPLLEAPSSSTPSFGAYFVPASSSSMIFGAAPPPVFGPCPAFGSFCTAFGLGSAPHTESSLISSTRSSFFGPSLISSTRSSFLGPPIGGAYSSGCAFGSSSVPPFSSWQSSHPFGAAVPGHGANNGCNSSVQGSHWSGSPLASSLTPSFASHHSNRATCAPLFGSPLSSPCYSNNGSLFEAVKKETVNGEEEARIVSVSVPRFLEAGDSHEEIRWSEYQKRSEERDFGSVVKSFRLVNLIPTSSPVGTPQIIRQDGQSLEGSSKNLSKFPISIQVVPPPFVAQSEIKLQPDSSSPKRNIMKAPSFNDEELPKVDTPPFSSRSDLSAKSENVVSYSFVLHQHRITIQMEYLNSHHQFGEEGVDVESCLPKLNHAEYYTEPTIQELATRERADPGYCSRVKDFVVGRHGYGSIIFPGETDVRSLELDSIIQFNSKEVMVYLDKTKRPPVGVGLNKPAVVTLLNVKYFDKKTEEQYTDGPILEKIKNLLTKKTSEHDAEFLSYDAVTGVWKFALKNFGHL